MNHLLFAQVKPEDMQMPSVASFMGEDDPEITNLSPLEAASANAEIIKQREADAEVALADATTKMLGGES